MSRIYEALQRAEQERRAGHEPEEDAASGLTDPSIADGPAEAAEKCDLALIQKFNWKPSPLHFPTLHGDGPGIERFRRLRSRLYQSRLDAPLKTVLISSGMPSEGKSFAAANIAVSLAHNTANNVLIIDADLRRPSLHSLYGAADDCGLSDFLAGSASLNDALQRDVTGKCCGTDGGSQGSNLFLMPAGKCGEKSFELISTPKFGELIRALTPSFEWILIDSPPALVVSDAVDLARSADGVLLMAREAQTQYADAQRTQAAFSNARILGFVLNDVKSTRRGNSYYGEYYYSNAKRHEANAS